MIINHKYKFIFIHVPKCAGTSIKRALYPYCNKHDQFFGGHPDVPEDNNEISKHSTAMEIKSFATEEKWKDYYSFAFVRSPIDRMISLYNWWHHTDGLFDLKKKEAICSMTFEEFVFSETTGPSMLSSLISKDVKDSFVSGERRIELDFIGRQESLGKDFGYICGLLGLPNIPLKRYNKSKDSLVHLDKIDKKTIREIKRKYHEDFECFYPNLLD